MAKRSDRKSDRNLRILVAQEAARLICEHGITDYGTAKHKAAENLGFSAHGALPGNRELEAAVAERSRIFAAHRNQDLLTELRLAAMSIMTELQNFNPRLVGQVLSGNVTEHSCIKLHLFSDPPENVGLQLAASGIRHSHTTQRLKLQRNVVEPFLGYRFFTGDFAVDTTVFTERRKNHAPLSPIDGKPMRRAKLSELQLLTNAQT